MENEDLTPTPELTPIPERDPKVAYSYNRETGEYWGRRLQILTRWTPTTG